jgi:3',5'-nucleoside bisphosphate phosphatase
LSQIQPSRAAATIDLHCHSTASDGLLRPADLVEKARALGLATIALTDHDTVAGIDEAKHAAEPDLEVIPGIELSSNVDGVEIHLLGYFVDPTSPELLAHGAWCREQRVERVERIIDRLSALGIEIHPADIFERAGTGTVGRPHVARELIDRGYADSIPDAFHRFLGSGRSAYVPRTNVSPRQAIEIIRRAGGVVVMAHPLAVRNYVSRLPNLIEEGLAGLEAHYGEYDESTRRHLAAVADDFRLIATGGSDYHGDGYKEGRGLGTVAVPEEAVTRLREAATRRALP